MSLLVACGEVPTGSGVVTGTVFAPAGESVVNTEVFACFNNETGCARLGSVTIRQGGASAAYTLSGLPSGSYGVYAFKDSDGDGEPSDGDLFGSWEEGGAALVTPPASGIDIVMAELTGVTPAPLRASLAKIASSN